MTAETTYTITPAGLAALEQSEFEGYAPCPDNDAPEAPETLCEAPTGENGPSDTFTPDTADKVDWVLGKIADARARALRVRENAERIARQHEAEAEGMEWRFGVALQAFARQETEGSRRRSVRLLNGVVGFRTRPASVTITNEPEARAWVEANLPQALRLDVRALSARLLQTGEAVDGTQLVPAQETFYIK